MIPLEFTCHISDLCLLFFEMNTGNMMLLFSTHSLRKLLYFDTQILIISGKLYTRGPQPLGHGRLPVCGPLGTRPHSRRWVVGDRAKLHLYLQPLPIAHITAWALPPVRSVAALDSHRSANPTVKCTCKGSRLHAPYENLIPDDLRWSWGSDASAGEWLQIQVIISREVWLHRDHSKSIACRLISKLYQWVASDN